MQSGLQYLSPIRVLALRDKDTESLSRSSSGGAFAVFARAVLRGGGVVFGTELSSDHTAKITFVENEGDLAKLQGSKYVQSSPGKSFEKCEQMLLNGRKVLFSGTPCQIFALKSYLNNNGVDYGVDQLLTVELICHGVTSPRLFKMYLDWLEFKLDALPGSLNYEFRSKKQSWGLSYHYSYISKSGKHRDVYGEARDDPYYRAFLSAKYYRKSCYSCRFAQPKRISDITIGDYWGIEKAHPDFYDQRGVSLVMLNSAHAVSFFENTCTDDCEWLDSTFELASAENMNLKHPSTRTKEDAERASHIEDAIASGDANYIFESLLADKSLKTRIKKLIPAEVLAAAFRMKRIKTKC